MLQKDIDLNLSLWLQLKYYWQIELRQINYFHLKLIWSIIYNSENLSSWGEIIHTLFLLVGLIEILESWQKNGSSFFLLIDKQLVTHKVILLISRTKALWLKTEKLNLAYRYTFEYSNEHLSFHLAVSFWKLMWDFLTNITIITLLINLGNYFEQQQQKKMDFSLCTFQ